MTMKQAQAKCRRLRSKGDKRSLAQAANIEAKFRSYSDYESDLAWLMRKQGGHR